MSASATEETTDLGDDLFRVRNHTLDDNRVRGRITGLEDDGGHITVRYEPLTTGEECHVVYEKPKTWSGSNPFVRLVEYCGYTSASAMQLEGDVVPLVYKDGEWVIDIDRLPGEQLVDRSDYFTGVLKGVGASLMVLVAAYIPMHIGLSVSIPMTSTGGVWPIMALFAGCALYLVFDFVWLPPQDDRRTLSPSEMSTDDIEVRD